MHDTVAIIPSYNEANNIILVTSTLRSFGIESIVAIAAKNTDTTEQLLKKNNVAFVKVEVDGYDPTILAGVAAIPQFFPHTKYVLFTDAGMKYEYQVVTEFLKQKEKNVDLILGIRNLNTNMLWHQRLGTVLVLMFVNFLFHSSIQDLTPLCVISYAALQRLHIRGSRFCFPTELIVKSLAHKLTIVQVPVVMRQRLSVSKISGSISNSIIAGIDMFRASLFVFLKNER